MQSLRLFLGVLVSCCAGICSCSQGNSSNISSTDIFVGSTPCDSLIKVLMNMPLKDPCDFIKWELNMNKDSGSFYMIVNWGESKPNTNWFKQVNKIEVRGVFSISDEMTNNPNRKLYRLSADKFSSPVLLTGMSNDVLHFLDSNQNLIVGNGGWGYVLNKLKSKN